MSLDDKSEAVAAATVGIDTAQADTHPPGIISSFMVVMLEVVDE